MAQVFSSIKAPANVALSNKINPSPLSPLKSSSGASGSWTPNKPSIFQTNQFSKLGSAAGQLGGKALSWLAGQPLGNSSSPTPTITSPTNYPSGTSTQSTPSGSIPTAAPVATTPTKPASTGYSNPFMAGGGNTQAPPPTNNTPVNIDYSSQESPFQKTARNLAEQQQGNATSNAAASGLLGIAQNGSNDVRQATSNIKGLQQTQTEIANNPNIASEVASGRGQALTGQIQAAQTGLSNALQGQGQQITAGQSAGNLGLTGQSNQITAQGTAGNLTAPVAGAAFFGSPTSGGLVGGQTGAGGATGNALIDSSVQAALNKFKAGGNINDARSSLSSLGQPALNAFDQAVNGGNYNPTALGAASQQNAAQGSQYQGKAADLNTNLTQMKNVTAPVLSLLQKGDLNQQDVPAFNGSVNEYASQFLNPSNQASLKAGIAELKTYVSNILGTGGDLTPTAVTQMVSSFDPGNFTRKQLSDFLDNLNNYGQARLQGFQQSSQGSYGGNIGFSGSAATPSGEATVSPNNPTSAVTATNPVAQGLIGGGMQALGGIEGMIAGIAGKVLK